MKRRYHVICLCNITIALILGALFYLFFRKNTYLHSFLQIYFHCQPPLIQLHNPIFTVIGNHFGDFVWAYALCNALYLFLASNKYAPTISWFGTTALGISLELMQKFEVIGGTFDYADIAAELIAAFLAVILIRRSLHL